MRCLICGVWNLNGLICKKCIPTLSLGKRLVDGVSVYSFYAFSEIEFLLHFKYQPIGSRIMTMLARWASLYFSQNFSFPHGLMGVGIDDRIKNGYSHTGIILHEFKRCGIQPIYGELKAKNPISYAGKSLQYRQANPKGFQTQLVSRDVVVMDDVITTGVSLQEAIGLLRSKNNRVILALTLCDARR